MHFSSWIASLVPEPFVKHSCNTKSNKASKGKNANSHTEPNSRVVSSFGSEGLLFGLGGLAPGDDLRRSDGVGLAYAICRCIHGAPLLPAGALLEGAAAALLTQPGDAVEVVGGHGLVLLLNKAEGWEVEASALAVSVLNHGGEPILGAGDEQVEEAGVSGQRRDGGVAPVKQDMVLACQVSGLDLNVDAGPQLNAQLWNDHWFGEVGVIEQLHTQGADESTIVVLDSNGGSRHINLGVVDQIL